MAAFYCIMTLGKYLTWDPDDYKYRCDFYARFEAEQSKKRIGNCMHKTQLDQNTKNAENPSCTRKEH